MVLGCVMEDENLAVYFILMLMECTWVSYTQSYVCV